MNERRMTPEQLVNAAAYSKKLENLKQLFATGRLEDIISFIGSKDASIPLPNGMTFLHYAAVNRDPRVILYFIDQGIDPNARTINGVTPILLAADCKNILGVTSLLARGADPYKKNPLKRDVLNILETKGVDKRTLESVRILVAERGKMSPPSPGRSSFTMYGENHSPHETLDDLPSIPLLLRFGKQKKE